MAKIKQEASWRTPAGKTILNLILFFGRPWQFDIDLSDSVFINSLYDGTRDHVRISVPN